MLKVYCLFVSLIPLFVHGKSLNAMAKSATQELRILGVSVIALGVVWAGYLYMRGGQEGKQKMSDVAIGAILILGGAAIVSFLQQVIR